jgi:hypothetical protein
MTFPRFLALVCLSLLLLVGVSHADTETGGPTADHSMGGGKGGGPPSANLTGPATSPTVVPEVKDPVDDPGGFLSDVKSAGKKSWPIAVVMVMVGGAIALRKRVAALRKPGTRTAAIVTGIVAVGTALLGYFGGLANLTEVLTAAAIAMGMIWAPQATDQDGDGKPDA